MKKLFRNKQDRILQERKLKRSKMSRRELYFYRNKYKLDHPINTCDSPIKVRLMKRQLYLYPKMIFFSNISSYLSKKKIFFFFLNNSIVTMGGGGI